MSAERASVHVLFSKIALCHYILMRENFFRNMLYKFEPKISFKIIKI